ncbi:MAG: TolC family protein [Deltaproteobacteria bacterium]|nr:TolC family protein [Deltaproteobacteria bacterium]
MNETHRMTIKGASRLRSVIVDKWTIVSRLSIILLLSALLIGTGCTASHYRKSADKAADSIIKEKQEQIFGKATGIEIERPSDTLRRRLMIEQDLQYSSNASLGSEKLEKIAHWPEKDYPGNDSVSSGDDITLESGQSLKLTLVQALQIAAKNSSEYQSQKESVFQKALDLNLQRHKYGFTLGGEDASYKITQSETEGETVKSDSGSGSLSLSKTLKNGTKIVTSAGVDIINLLTDGISTKSFQYDGSISIPLLRGAGKYVASESLTQAERDLVYSLYTFERYKGTFAVQIVQSYMSVLSQMDQVDNAAENYKNSITSYNRTSRQAEAGRATIVQVNQTLQQQLSSRNRWINAKGQYKNQLDNFKIMIGLPADSEVELDRSDLESLTERAADIVTRAVADTSTSENLFEPGKENAGPLEMDEEQAITLAFDNRLDLKVQEGKVYDAQRAVVIRADALGAELTLLGSAKFTGDDEEAFEKDSGIYTGLLTLDLPFDRTSERNAYRNAYISLEKAVREFQTMEDNIKLSIRQTLRTMAEAREGLRIQTLAVNSAETGLASANMFFEAGRSELRDLLEAQSSLLTARNSLTSAVINYRMAELQFQRDAGILKIDDEGLLVEYGSEEDNNVKQQ